MKVLQDEDFINHAEAEPETIAHYEEHGNPVPDITDLHFDLLGDTHSVWNAKIFDMLRKEFIEREQKQIYPLPDMSDDYIETLIADRYTRLKTLWMTGMRQRRMDGSVEKDADVEARLILSREEQLKAIRHRKRHSTVCRDVSQLPFLMNI